MLVRSEKKKKKNARHKMAAFAVLVEMTEVHRGLSSKWSMHGRVV